MNKAERNKLRLVFEAVKIWRKYRDRVELVRAERRAQMLSEREAAEAWDIVLTESPYAEAYAAACAAENTGIVVPVQKKAKAKEEAPESDDDSESENIKQSAQANHAWVASICHKGKLKRKDAPNDAAYNLYTWVRSDAANMSEFMKSQIKMGSAKEGANSEKMGEDGRESLEHVERMLEKDYGVKSDE